MSASARRIDQRQCFPVAHKADGAEAGQKDPGTGGLEQAQGPGVFRLCVRAGDDRIFGLCLLQQRRPAPPVLTPESGSYATYISVAAESNYKIYLRTDGAYPSRER